MPSQELKMQRILTNSLYHESKKRGGGSCFKHVRIAWRIIKGGLFHKFFFKELSNLPK